MKVLVSGATGFIGRHMVRFLRRETSHEVVAIGRREGALRDLGCPYEVYDLDRPALTPFDQLGRPDALIHLAWQGLPRYTDISHVESHLMASYRFLSDMVRGGLPRLSCAGTCFEYGMQEGRLVEEAPTRPVTAYGIAKDCLRRFLEVLRIENPYALRWLRIFYTYGPGQRANSLFGQLDSALRDRAGTFDMSGGEQLRDYLPVELLARYLVEVALQDEYEGVFNICSGKPTSIRSLVEARIRESGVNLALNLGRFPYTEYEPMAFWGDDRRLRLALASYEEHAN